MTEKAETLVRLLEKKKWHVTFAESCTGGLLAATLVSASGASAVLDESYVTYANESKMRLCGVREETLARYGAVSEETAREMAEGARKRAGADVAVAVSGIAGPLGGTEGKPVGTVAFAFAFDGKTETVTVHFGNIGRTQVREASVLYVLDTLISHPFLQ